MQNFKPSDNSKVGLLENEPEIKDEPILATPIPDIESTTLGKSVTLEAFRTEYTDFVKQSKSKHYLSSVKLAFNFLIADTGDIQLVQIDRRMLEKFILKSFKRTQQGASLFYRTLKAAFAKAEDWEYISENPFKKLKKPKVAESLPEFLSSEQLAKICSLEPREDLKRIYQFAYYTGMRRAEIVNLAWENVDLDRKVIKVGNGNGFTTKSKKERIIPICTPLESILQELFRLKSETALYVFETSRGVKYHDETLSKNFKETVRAAKISEKIHFHTLRHSFASQLVQNGVSVYVVMQLLGHADIATTMVYSHLKKDNLVEAVTTFDRDFIKSA
ncbi:MAG: site-specific integrase [Ignavibacteriales bacterium]|nr:site-specific integrase [Ignavibacteriales bacterium]